MTADKLSQYKSVLQSYWGFDQFRDAQLAVIQHLAEQKNTLAILPTGGGKSICYQVPALCHEGICIVISPLIALMLDQVTALKNKDIAAAALYGSISKLEQEEIVAKAVHGELKLLYISPERLSSKSFLRALPKMKVDFIAVDEAHCISQWGHDFRPAYRHINSLRELFPIAQVLAVTATATPKVQKDILASLNMEDAAQVVYPSRRTNLGYKVIETENKLGVLQSIVLAHKKETGIVYARSRKLVAKLTQYLKKRKVKVGSYHAGLSSEKKNKNQAQWFEGKLDIMVATNAFGMGIDKADVRYVVHYDLAPNLEEYTQEAGRAGRDGDICEAIILIDQNDVEEKKKDIEKSYPPIHLIKDSYKALASHFNLAIGELMPKAKTFQLLDFCQKYGLPILPTYYSLKILDKTDYIMLTDSFYQSSEIQCSKEQLDAFNSTSGNELAKDVINKILRIYDGLFYKHVKIDESYLATKVVATIDETKEALRFLNNNGVVDYIEGGSNPKIKVRGRRRHSDAIQIRPEIYGLRKQEAFDKLAELDKYLKGQKCRQIIIDAYFGFEETEACGICDFCIDATNKNVDHSFLENKIIKLLKQDVTELEKLMQEFTKSEQKDLVTVLENMESNKIVSIISNHIILER